MKRPVASDQPRRRRGQRPARRFSFFALRFSFLLALCLCVSVAFPAQADCAFDATTNSGAQGSASSYSWSHTNTGSDLALKVSVSIRSAGVTVSSITYNSVGLTFLRTDGPTSLTTTEIWYLVGPATGTNTVAVTLSGAPSRSIAGATSWTGVDQGSPIDAQAGSTGSASSVTTNITVGTNACLDDVVALRTSASQTATASGGQTQDWNVLDAANGMRGAGSHKGPLSGAQSMGWSFSGSVAHAHSVVSFKSAGGAPTPRRRRILITLGHPVTGALASTK